MRGKPQIDSLTQCARWGEARIAPLLARFDATSATVFEANRAALLPSLDPDGLKLAKQLSDFDYPGALTTRQRALQNLRDAKETTP